MRQAPLRVFLAALIAGPLACSALLPEVGADRASGADAARSPEASAESGGPDAASDGALADVSPSVFTVVVAPNGDHTFVPRDLTIKVGDTVHWVWQGGGHTVTSGSSNADGIFCSPNDGNCANAGTSDRGFVYDHTFTSAGLFPYFCRPHRSSGMTGTITVE